MPIAYLEPVSNTQRLRKIVRVLRAHSVLPRRKLVDIAQRSENETPVVDVADDLDVIGLLEHRCAEVQPAARWTGANGGLAFFAYCVRHLHQVGLVAGQSMRVSPSHSQTGWWRQRRDFYEPQHRS